MMSPTETTILLRAANCGDAQASEQLLPLVYEELCSMANRFMQGESARTTLSATGLVHEAYLRLVEGSDWADRAHFLAIASRAMRQILVDRARARNASKRGGNARDLTLVEEHVEDPADLAGDDVLAIHGALNWLAQHDERLARLVELRFFGGLEVREAAHVLGVSSRTAARMWARAQAHLRRRLD